MEIIWQELTTGLPNGQRLAQVVLRLIAAVLVGSIIGYERERAGKAAGLRTHILVTLGTCVFVLAGTSYEMSNDSLARVIQGIATGIGFIGAGSILKLTAEHHIRGLTTAASIWMTAAVGVTVGLGMLGLALLAAVLSVIVLRAFHHVDTKANNKHES